MEVYLPNLGGNVFSIGLNQINRKQLAFARPYVKNFEFRNNLWLLLYTCRRRLALAEAGCHPLHHQEVRIPRTDWDVTEVGVAS